jgi:hypothetical protein
MQSETGCKINVSQASGADIEREIGLVGSRQAIEDAKKAIWEKVDQVVCLNLPMLYYHVLILYSVTRTVAVDVTMAMPTVMAAMITITHNRHSLQLMVMVVLHPRSLLRLQPILQAVQLLIPMLFMVVTRTISQCGMLRLPNNSSKEGHRPSPDPRLAHFDAAHVAETSSLDACFLAARGMT